MSEPIETPAVRRLTHLVCFDSVLHITREDL
jgi:hypothetical protein